jgi:hypothetical protein
MDHQKSTPAAGDHQQIAASIRETMTARGLSQAEVARMVDISGGALSAFLSGTYKGNNDEVARKLLAWHAGLAAGDSLSAIADRLKSFADTPGSRRIIGILNLAKLMGTVVAVAGRSGTGKTMACRRFAASTPAVWYCEFSKDTASVYAVLKEIAEAVGITEPPQRPDELRREIVKRIRRTQGLIICDEAHQLTPVGLEEIRTLYDRTGVGIAFCGHLDLRDKIARLPQLDGRVSAPLTIGAAKPDDVDALLTAWGCECKRTSRFLRDKAGQAKGLRRIARTYQLAAINAAGQGTELSFENVRRAWATLEGSTDHAA